MLVTSPGQSIDELIIINCVYNDINKTTIIFHGLRPCNCFVRPCCHRTVFLNQKITQCSVTFIKSCEIIQYKCHVLILINLLELFALHTFIMNLNAKLSVVARMVSFETLWHHKILNSEGFSCHHKSLRLIWSPHTPPSNRLLPIQCQLLLLSVERFGQFCFFFLTPRSTLELNVCSVSRWTFPLLLVRLLSACVFPTPGVGLVSSSPSPQKNLTKSNRARCSKQNKTCWFHECVPFW